MSDSTIRLNGHWDESEMDDRIGHVFRKRQPVIGFASEHVTDLPSRMHFVDATCRSIPAVGIYQQHFAFLAEVGAIEPGLGSIGLGTMPLPSMDRRRGHFILFHLVGRIEIQDSLAGIADDKLLAVPYLVVGLGTQHYLASHTFVVANLRQPAAPELHHPFVVAQ